MTPAAAAQQAALLAQLLSASARRDRRAFARLYDATSSKLFGVALRILRREDWAEEVLQECYVSIWTHAPDYRAGLAAPMTWMTSTVRNRCLDWLRRPRLEVADEDDAIAESTESDQPGPLAELERSTEAQQIWALPKDGKPRGGSKTGAPTGPVLYTGPCLKDW